MTGKETRAKQEQRLNYTLSLSLSLEIRSRVQRDQTIVMIPAAFSSSSAVGIGARGQRTKDSPGTWEIARARFIPPQRASALTRGRFNKSCRAVSLCKRRAGCSRAIKARAYSGSLDLLEVLYRKHLDSERPTCPIMFKIYKTKENTIGRKGERDEKRYRRANKARL